MVGAWHPETTPPSLTRYGKPCSQHLGTSGRFRGREYACLDSSWASHGQDGSGRMHRRCRWQQNDIGLVKPPTPVTPKFDCQSAWQSAEFLPYAVSPMVVKSSDQDRCHERSGPPIALSLHSGPIRQPIEEISDDSRRAPRPVSRGASRPFYTGVPHRV